MIKRTVKTNVLFVRKIFRKNENYVIELLNYIICEWKIFRKNENCVIELLKNTGVITNTVSCHHFRTRTYFLIIIIFFYITFTPTTWAVKLEELRHT